MAGRDKQTSSHHHSKGKGRRYPDGAFQAPSNPADAYMSGGNNETTTDTAATEPVVRRNSSTVSVFRGRSSFSGNQSKNPGRATYVGDVTIEMPKDPPTNTSALIQDGASKKIYAAVATPGHKGKTDWSVKRWSESTQKWLQENEAGIKAFVKGAALAIQGAGKLAQSYGNANGNPQMEYYGNLAQQGGAHLETYMGIQDTINYGSAAWNNPNPRDVLKTVASVINVAGGGLAADGQSARYTTDEQNMRQGIGQLLQGAGQYAYGPTQEQQLAATQQQLNDFTFHDNAHINNDHRDSDLSYTSPSPNQPDGASYFDPHRRGSYTSGSAFPMQPLAQRNTLPMIPAGAEVHHTGSGSGSGSDTDNSQQRGRGQQQGEQSRQRSRSR
ncbi:hypothetical protein ACIPC1_36785 [Streptomyces sp. NPDC087263]|uniref:hypothetical protein n=1 Tax=Streptomyces sp. NPDC087263 TaxID=3365773 RepID=UPI00382D8747